MAWRSSGVTNDEMVDKLKLFGVIRSDAVERAFRAVDRKWFVPPNLIRLAHSDQPIREGTVHLSAPHIYGSVLEALDLEQPSCQHMTFLNIGSGTGYLSCLVAELLGPASLCFGIEVDPQVVAHSRQATRAWREHQQQQDATTTTTTAVAHMEIIHGNGLEINATVGEPLVGFDRIYVGASIHRKDLPQLADLLRPGGVLVGPVGDELVKVIRVAKTGLSSNRSEQAEDASSITMPRTFRGRAPLLSEDFTTLTLSGVRFTPLVRGPSFPVVIRSRIWEPSLHRFYPESFRKSCKEIMLCSRASPVQMASPPRPMQKQNVAAALPRALWMEVLSYTHRDWFEQLESEESRLKSRIRQLEFSLEQAMEAKQQVEKRLRITEGERDLYRDMAFSWQARIEHALAGDATAAAAHLNQLAVLHQQQQQQQQNNDNDDDDDNQTLDESVTEHLGEGDDQVDAMEEEEEEREMEDRDDTAEPMSISLPIVAQVLRSQRSVTQRTVSITSSDL